MNTDKPIQNWTERDLVGYALGFGHFEQVSKYATARAEALAEYRKAIPQGTESLRPLHEVLRADGVRTAADAAARDSLVAFLTRNMKKCRTAIVVAPKILTVRELAAIHGGGIILNDRGNGSSGPSYLSEDSLDDIEDKLTQVTEEEDANAWMHARDAAKAINGSTPTVVCVGEWSSAGWQGIYAV